MEGNVGEARCVFCGHGNNVEDVCGKLHSYHQQTSLFAAHHKCMQYSAELTQYKFESFGGFFIEEVEQEENRGKEKVCSSQHCYAISRTGAISQCAWTGCLKPFHFICAHKENVTSQRKRGSIYNFLVFCNDKHKKEYLKGVEEGENLSTNENEEDGVDSPRASSGVEGEGRGTGCLQSPCRSRNSSDMAQKTDDSMESSLSCSLFSPSDAEFNKIESESARTSSEINTNVPSTSVEMFPILPGNSQSTEDSSDENAMPGSSSRNQGKRKAETRSPPRKKRDRKSKSEKEHQRSKKGVKSKSYHMLKTKNRAWKKLRMVETDSEDSDISVRTKDSSGSASSLSELPSKSSRLSADDSDERLTNCCDTSVMETSKRNLPKLSLENLCDASENPQCSVDCSSPRAQSSCGSQMKDLNYKRSQKHEDGKKGSGQNGSSASAKEFLMILATFSNEFEAKKAEVCQHLADQWKTDMKHVYIWSQVAPVIVEEEIMLSFLACITDAANCGRWRELRLLLLDAETIQNKCEELQGNKMAVQNESQKARKLETHQFSNLLINPAVKEATAADLNCIILEINSTTDPLHLIRDSLQKPHLFPLQKETSFTFRSERVRKNALKDEFSALKTWFTTCIQNVQKVMQHPSDEVLYMPGAENDELYAVFMSEVQQLVDSNSEEVSSPVVVFAGNLNYDIVVFKEYLEALARNMLTTYTPHPVICILPVSNLKSFSCPGVSYSCWSAFDPTLKPISYIVVTLD